MLIFPSPTKTVISSTSVNLDGMNGATIVSTLPVSRFNETFLATFLAPLTMKEMKWLNVSTKPMDVLFHVESLYLSQLPNRTVKQRKRNVLYLTILLLSFGASLYLVLPLRLTQPLTIFSTHMKILMNPRERCPISLTQLTLTPLN